MNSVSPSTTNEDWRYTPDPTLHDGIVKDMLKSVLLRCKKRPGVEKDDLLQVGRIGLIQACRKYDRSRNICISTYVRYTVKRRIKDEIFANSRPIRLPRKMYTGGYVEGGRGYTAAEKLRARRFIGGNSLGSLIDDRDSCESSAILSEDLSRLHHALDRLDPEQKRVIVRHHGLDGRDPMSISDIGKELGKSYAQIRHLQIKAMRSIRDLMKVSEDELDLGS